MPTDAPESDGTFEWHETTIVVVHATSGGVTGLGYSYGPAAAARLVAGALAPVASGRDAMDVEASYARCDPISRGRASGSR